jgi:signal transduction histidine kinase
VRVRLDVAAGEAVLAVADTGCGIPQEDWPHLFERFYRVDRARSRASGGTGLGLAICKTIVEAHGGAIGFDTEPGRGSTFWVRLPCRGANRV